MKPYLLAMSSMLALGAVDAAAAQVSGHGEYLARAGDCIACHTAPGGQPYAGGLGLKTPLGILYSTNITPDPQTGLGQYSFEDFDNAVRRGVRKDGSSLYPAMPFPSYAQVSEADMRDLYGYFMTGVTPVAHANRSPDIPWPLSIRWPLGWWSWMFAPKPAVVEAPPATERAARGAYLVEGLGHCGSCHTPRALTLEEKTLADDRSKAYLSGGAPIDGWIAKDLRGSAMTGLGKWSEADLVEFLRTGKNNQSAAFGGMKDVIENSLQYLSDEDLHAIAQYLKSLSPDEAPLHSGADAQASTTTADLHALRVESDGARIYADNCMACHRSDGKGYEKTFPGLSANTVLNDPQPDSVIRIVLAGATGTATDAAPTAYTMPAFAWRLSDPEVAAVASFIRSAWGNTGSAVSAKDVAHVRHDLSSAGQ
ncbi:cytochrome c [Pseudomonas sp. RIT-PI-S]|uniref:c-type cytochrome n=1 Tax=Pseudomonas sp. RIT-PI-S TaxID=3035295 RepID=UPI0021D8057C|nr:cytochrome c [Pseudomonas sp. RIT-PI-S]